MRFSRTVPLLTTALATLLFLPIAARDPGASSSDVGKLTDAAAREEVERLVPKVATIRGLAFTREVPVSVVSDADVREYAMRRFQRFQTESELEASQKAYELLGLLPPGFRILEEYLDVLEEQTGGFYDPDSKSFFLVDEIVPELAGILSSHELAHALEDQHYDLDGRLDKVAGNDELVFTRSAVHEGSATLVMGLYLVDALMNGRVKPEHLEAMASSEAGRGEKLAALPPVLRRMLLGSYMLGATFLLRGEPARLAEGFPVQDVDRAYREPPSSSEQILHPEKYWDAEGRDDPRPVNLGDAGDRLGRRWRKTLSGTLGELAIGVMVGAPTPAGNMIAMDEMGEWTNEAASGWGGDRWELWTRGGASVVLLKTVWDSPADASEFASALPEPRPGFLWKSRGDAVAFVAGDAGKRADRVMEALLGVD